MIWTSSFSIPTNAVVVPTHSVTGNYGCCLQNTIDQCDLIGGFVVEGVIVHKHIRLPLFQLIRHWLVWDGLNYIDPTPYEDGREFIVFIPQLHLSTYNIFTQSLESISNSESQENELMYYVYMYRHLDTNAPMYVGKGSQNRAQIHLTLCKSNRDKQKTRFYNKLETLISEGKEPIIEFVAQNIVDEEVAYLIERDLIFQYGRLGYEADGILLNTCVDSSPPNHKGKTYKEIYGDRWEEQIEKRRATQIQRGGFGPKQHSEQFKLDQSKRFSGTGNPRYGANVTKETRQKISDARRGQRMSGAKTYILDHLDGRQFTIKGSTDVIAKCQELDVSWSTLYNQINKGWSRAKRGKTAGWRLQVT